MPSARSQDRPVERAPERLCAFGLPTYTATALRPCSARIGESRRSISSKASSQLASTSSPSRRTSGVVSRSGSSWSCLSPYAFGQMKPRLNTSSRSPRTDTTSRPRSRPPGRRWPRRTGRCGSAVATAPSLLRSRSSIQSARDAQARRPPSRTARSRPGACARPRRATTTASACGSPTRTAHPIRAVSRARTTGGPSPKLATGALVGQSSAAQTHSGRTCPSSSASDSSGSSRRRRGRRGRPAGPGRCACPSPRGALGPADDAGRERVRGGPALAAGRPRPPRRSPRGTGSGTSSRSSRLALGDERVAVAELHAPAVARHVERPLERRRRAQRDLDDLGAHAAARPRPQV